MGKDRDRLEKILDPILFECIEANGAVRIKTWLVRPDGATIDLFALRSDKKWILVSGADPWYWVQEQALENANHNVIRALGFIVDSEMHRAAQFFDLSLVPDKDAFIQSGVEDSSVVDAVYRLAFGVFFFIERTLEEVRLASGTSGG